MKLPASLLIGLAFASTAFAAPSTPPPPSAISAALTPAVNAKLRAAHVTSFRFARAACIREATPGHYLCTALHVLNGVPTDGYSDVWEVVVRGARWTYGPASVCPLANGKCANTDLTALTPG